jgi:alpha-1,2-mannosyltransferase
MARAVPKRHYTGALAALRQTSAIFALALLPAFLAVTIIGGAIGNRYGFDFHGSLWEATRAVLHGRNPYPPPTVAGVSPGDRFVYPPAIAFVFLPFGILPFPVAAGLMTALLAAAMAATLYVLDVRDWRCYGATFASIPVLHDIRLGAITPLLALALALAWKHRDRAHSAIPLAFAVVAKLFLWPLLVWLVATGRLRIAVRTVAYAVVATALAWIAIRLAGLADYPALIRVLSTVEQGRGYSLVSAGLALGMGTLAARVAAGAIGVALLALCARSGRRGDDTGSFILLVGAALALSPIVWLHYFILLFVPIAITRRTFSAIWLAPLLYWSTPYEEHFGDHWRIALGLAITTFVLVASWRGRVVPAEM